MAEDENVSWLLTPTGMLVSRVVQTLLKCILVFISAKVPALGLGPDVDRLVQELSPVAAVAICVWWTKQQHTHSEVVKAVAVAQATAQANPTPAQNG